MFTVHGAAMVHGSWFMVQVARIGFDNDGFMSDASDGGTWTHTGDQDPNHKAPTYPAMAQGGPVGGSLASPTQGSAHGLFTDPDYGHVQAALCRRPLAFA